MFGRGTTHGFSRSPEIAMELHALNRAKLVHSFRQYLKASSRPLFGFVLLQGGQEQTRFCSDHVTLFRQESYFAYFFGVREPGFYGAVDISSGKSILFAPRLSEDYAIWSGKIKPLSSFKKPIVWREDIWLARSTTLMKLAKS